MLSAGLHVHVHTQTQIHTDTCTHACTESLRVKVLCNISVHVDAWIRLISQLGLFPCCLCPSLPPHPFLLPPTGSPPLLWQGSHAACASTPDVLPGAPGPDGPLKLLLINHRASQRCAQPLSPLNLPRPQCVGPNHPVSTTSSSSRGNMLMVPFPSRPRTHWADS